MAKNHPPEDDCCSLCFDSFKFPCQTNCGHWYCGSCFMKYWRQSEGTKSCNCPICRCLVNNLTLLDGFVPILRFSLQRIITNTCHDTFRKCLRRCMRGCVRGGRRLKMTRLQGSGSLSECFVTLFTLWGWRP